MIQRWHGCGRLVTIAILMIAMIVPAAAVAQEGGGGLSRSDKVPTVIQLAEPAFTVISGRVDHVAAGTGLRNFASGTIRVRGVRPNSTIQKAFLVVRQSTELPGTEFIARLRKALGPSVRPNRETNQYVVSTPNGQILAQSDEEFPVGECVEVIPHGENLGPAFRYGEAQVVRSTNCG